MSTRTGKLIAIEGVDGCGKETQAQRLHDYLNSMGVKVLLLTFPQYQITSYGFLIRQYLDGEFGDKSALPAELISSLYAADRLVARESIYDALERGVWVICDRYVLSNVAYQAAKLTPGEERDKLEEYIVNMEYEQNKMPIPDVTLFLDLSVSHSTNAMKGRDTIDIHEKDKSYLDRVYDYYQEIQGMIVAGDNDYCGEWLNIPCQDEDGKRYNISEVSELITVSIGSKLFEFFGGYPVIGVGVIKKPICGFKKVTDDDVKSEGDTKNSGSWHIAYDDIYLKPETLEADYKVNLFDSRNIFLDQCKALTEANPLLAPNADKVISEIFGAEPLLFDEVKGLQVLVRKAVSTPSMTEQEWREIAKLTYRKIDYIEDLVCYTFTDKNSNKSSFITVK